MKKEVITPQVAKALLDKNTNNRTITKSHLAMLKSEILDGNWQYNGQPIIIGQTGRLLDGQHRLTAVIETGIPIETAVVRGVDEEAFVTMDTGKVRGGSDVLSIAGSKHGTHIASAIRKIEERFGGTKKCQGRYAHKITNSDYLSQYEEKGKELTELFDLTHSWVLNGSRLLSESDAMAFIVLLKKESDLIFNFLEEVITGRAISKSSNSAQTCRKKIIDMKFSGNQIREFQKKDWVLYCFRKYVAGVNCKNIVIKEPLKFLS